MSIQHARNAESASTPISRGGWRYNPSDQQDVQDFASHSAADLRDLEGQHGYNFDDHPVMEHAEMVRVIVAARNGDRDAEPLPAETIAPAVALLDQDRPNWRRQIDLDRLDATSGWSVLGQLYGIRYRAGLDELNIRDDYHATELGFAPSDRTSEGWARFWATWRAEVLRRDAVTVQILEDAMEHLARTGPTSEIEGTLQGALSIVTVGDPRGAPTADGEAAHRALNAWVRAVEPGHDRNHDAATAHFWGRDHGNRLWSLHMAIRWLREGRPSLED